MPCSRTRLRHSSTVGRLTPSFSAIATFCSPATAPKIIRQRRATCCGVPWADSHCSSCVRSAACKLIGKLVFGMLEIIATAVKYVKLFMIHYTRVTFLDGLTGRLTTMDGWEGWRTRTGAPHVGLP